mmetsp:Transcript_51990/g.137588  ORF Transcript_51990/g.137588 Transcript_51990/m.137588 type:complete len:216 (+) Transcript_51990:381-1028(+)
MAHPRMASPQSLPDAAVLQQATLPKTPEVAGSPQHLEPKHQRQNPLHRCHPSLPTLHHRPNPRLLTRLATAGLRSDVWLHRPLRCQSTSSQEPLAHFSNCQRCHRALFGLQALDSTSDQFWLFRCPGCPSPSLCPCLWYPSAAGLPTPFHHPSRRIPGCSDHPLCLYHTVPGKPTQTLTSGGSCPGAVPRLLHELPVHQKSTTALGPSHHLCHLQ